jgi:hypothetical protein
MFASSYASKQTKLWFCTKSTSTRMPPTAGTPDDESVAPIVPFSSDTLYYCTDSSAAGQLNPTAVWLTGHGQANWTELTAAECDYSVGLDY